VVKVPDGSFFADRVLEVFLAVRDLSTRFHE
jgi:hypothetical protein